MSGTLASTMRHRLPDVHLANQHRLANTLKGIALALLVSVCVHALVAGVAALAPRRERTEPLIALADLRPTEADLAPKEVEVAGLLRQGDPNKAQGSPPAPTDPPQLAPPPKAAVAAATSVPEPASPTDSPVRPASAQPPAKRSAAAPKASSSASAPKASSSPSANNDDEQPGEGGGSKVKADQPFLKAMAFHLPLFSSTLAWSREPAGAYGSAEYRFELDADGNVVGCNAHPPGHSPPALIGQTIERVCKRLMRGTYALGTDGLSRKGVQIVHFSVELSDVPVSDAPADGVEIKNAFDDRNPVQGKPTFTLVGGRRVVFAWRAARPILGAP